MHIYAYKLALLNEALKHLWKRAYYSVRINWYESSAYINFSSEHISSGYFDYKQLLMKGFCDTIGEFHANITVKNSEDHIFRGVLMRGVPNFLFNSNHFGPI